LAIYSSVLRQDSTGLISVEFLEKILDFSYIFDWDFLETEQNKVEFSELKNKLSNLILKFLEIALKEKKSEIIWEYLKTIKQEVKNSRGNYFKNLNITNNVITGALSRKESIKSHKSTDSSKPEFNKLYLVYKLLKLLYLTNKKGKISK
jgi:hypothetical protein